MKREGNETHLTVTTTLHLGRNETGEEEEAHHTWANEISCEGAEANYDTENATSHSREHLRAYNKIFECLLYARIHLFTYDVF